MFFIPLSHAESVQLVINALKVAGGEADCTSCPANKVCMKQCLSISEAIAKMLDEGSLPMAGEPSPPPGEAEPEPPSKPGKLSHLKIVK